jgi:hypothetical protein
LKDKYIITEETLDSCAKFATASVQSSIDKYKRRNQFNVEKIIKDIKVGKLGEECVYDLVSKTYPTLSKPDYNIYDKKDKSWLPDLKTNEFFLAVKTQNIDSAIAYGESWVFQYNFGKNYDCDKGIFKSEDDNHYVAFVAMNVPKRFANIRAIVKVSWLHKNKLFKEMKKENLRGNKLAIYYNDLEQFENELWQL